MEQDGRLWWKMSKSCPTIRARRAAGPRLRVELAAGLVMSRPHSRPSVVMSCPRARMSTPSSTLQLPDDQGADHALSMAAQLNGHKLDEGAANVDERSTVSEVSTADHVESDDDDEEDEEPKLKYDRLTGYLGSVYRNGDATSSFLVGGDKMV